MTPPFKCRHRNTADEVGRIRVQVTLLRPDAPHMSSAKKGNICRSSVVYNARVSEVFAVVDKALFGDMARDG